MGRSQSRRSAALLLSSHIWWENIFVNICLNFLLLFVLGSYWHKWHTREFIRRPHDPRSIAAEYVHRTCTSYIIFRFIMLKWYFLFDINEYLWHFRNLSIHQRLPRASTASAFLRHGCGWSGRRTRFWKCVYDGERWWELSYWTLLRYGRYH